MAEQALEADDFALVDRLWADWSPSLRVSDEERGALKAMFRQPGVVANALAYYRQAYLPGTVPEAWREKAMARPPIHAPTLYLHGRDDGCIGADLGAGMAALFKGPFERKVIEGAGHFLQLEQPGLIAGEIVNFLARGSGE